MKQYNYFVEMCDGRMVSFKIYEGAEEYALRHGDDVYNYGHVDQFER